VSTDRGFDLEPPWRLDLDGKLGCPVPSSLVNFRVYGRYIGGIAIDIEYITIDNYDITLI
jgi:hypothetical protein